MTSLQNEPDANRCPAWDAVPEDEMRRRPIGRVADFAWNTLVRMFCDSSAVDVPSDANAVVVFTGGNLGGAVLSIPLVTAVRRRFSGSHLAVVSNTAIGRDVMRFAGVGDSHHVIREGSLRSARGIFDLTRELRILSRLKPELSVANFNSQVDHLLLPLKIPVRVGHHGERATGGELRRQGYLNFRVPVSTGDNWHDAYRTLAARIGADWPLTRPTITVSDQLCSEARARLRALGWKPNTRLLAVQVGVWQGQDWKQWPLKRLTMACRHIAGREPVAIAAMGDHSAIPSMARISEIAPELNWIDLVGKTSLPEAAAVLRVSDVSLCNDSGLMHLSAAVGTTTVAVYGMTDPTITWCYDSPHRIVRRSDCRPCHVLGGDLMTHCPHRMCLTQLSVSTVVEAVEAAFSEKILA